MNNKEGVISEYEKEGIISEETRKQIKNALKHLKVGEIKITEDEIKIEVLKEKIEADILHAILRVYPRQFRTFIREPQHPDLPAWLKIGYD